MPTTITGTDGVSQVQTGAVESGDLPAGSVIQVVTTTSTTGESTTSTSYQTSALSASITPSSVSNKILVLCSVPGSGLSDQFHYTIFRDSTNIGGAINDGLGVIRDRGGSGTDALATSHILDSPSTTSSVNYSFRYKSQSGGNVEILAQFYEAHITLMEIAG